MRPFAGRLAILAMLGLNQILAYGSTYYLLTALVRPMSADTGRSASLIVAGLTLGSLTAGAMAPRIGRIIDSRGGRNVLAASSILLATGLAAIAAAPAPVFYLAAWVILGLGMGAGLCDAAFGTLGRLYGQGARSAITALTLIAGFASTIFWPMTAALDQASGWRGVCLIDAGLQLALALPLYLTVIAKAAPPEKSKAIEPASYLSAMPARTPHPTLPRKG